MGDPVTMAMIGAGVGAITNPRKPLQGALLGGALGGFGGAAMGAGNAAATTAMKGAVMPAAGTTGVAAGTPIASFGTAGGTFATPTMPVYAATGGTTGLIPSMTAPVTMMDRFKALGQFNRENPMVGQVGSSALRDIMQPQPMAAAAPPGLLRGTPSQEQPMQYAMQMPQVSLI
jgi:hypothetical protein